MTVYPWDPHLSARHGMPETSGVKAMKIQFLPSSVPQENRAHSRTIFS